MNPKTTGTIKGDLEQHRGSKAFDPSSIKGSSWAVFGVMLTLMTVAGIYLAATGVASPILAVAALLADAYYLWEFRKWLELPKQADEKQASKS